MSGRLGRDGEALGQGPRSGPDRRGRDGDDRAGGDPLRTGAGRGLHGHGRRWSLERRRARQVAHEPPAQDTDGDGIRDDREDPDRDGLWSITDDRSRLSPVDADSDNDGTRDGLEDADDDGLVNLWEQRLGTNPALRDTDGAGTPDPDEDADADGLANAAELALSTDPLDADSDDDGTLDGDEPVPTRTRRSSRARPGAWCSPPTTSGTSGWTTGRWPRTARP